MSNGQQDLSLSSDAFLGIMEMAQSDLPIAARRRKLGKFLLEALESHTFVSYISDEDGSFHDPVDVNLGEDSLRIYDAEFKSVDEMTPRLFQRGGTALIVTNEDTTDEFIRGVLHPRGMHYGMNYFAKSPGVGDVDLRVWRDAASGPYSTHEYRVMDAVGRLIERLWRTAESKTVVHLTPRQLEVASLVADGLADKQICSRLKISHPTLRTHLGNLYEKLELPNRAALASYFIRHHQN